MPSSPDHESLTEFSRTPESINNLESESEMEPEQPCPAPNMSSIVRPEVELIKMSMPCFPLSETKPRVIIDKTQDIILDLLISTVEIYLAQEEVSQNKEIENPANSPKWKYGKWSKGNRLKAPYKDIRGGAESTPKWSGKPFHYSQPKESLFYKETMARTKKTAKLKYVERQTQKAKPTKGPEKQRACLTTSECEYQ